MRFAFQIPALMVVLVLKVLDHSIVHAANSSLEQTVKYKKE